MKNFLIKNAIMIALSLGAIINTASAQLNDADPAITSASFAQSPVLEGGVTTFTVFFANNGNDPAFGIPIGKVGLNISLPTSGEYRAFPESIAAISGTYASKFTFSYNATTKTFFGTNNAVINPGDGGTIVVTVKGIMMVLSRVTTVNILRLFPQFYPLEDVSNNNLTAALGVAPGIVAIGNLDFNAKKADKSVNLDWVTSTEQNSASFDVEFSREGSRFEKLGTVAAAGTSTTPRSYSFVHTKPVNGLNYYRLRQVDIDGSFRYSIVRTVKFSNGNSITVMPNPTTDRIYINSNSGGIMQSIEIFTTEGKKMQQINNFPIGNSIDLSKYAPAAYILRMTDKTGSTEVIRIIKN
ncbi:MAG: T9SS type A sorting domain-containing protein [Ferruginibacter sp.]